MYLSHFNLQEKPFKISTDPKFLWMGEKHKQALETLRYGILYDDGYVVVTGDVGTGKTTLASALVNNLMDKVIIAKVPYPDVDTLDFFKLISTTYGLSESFGSKGSFLSHFESFLRSSFSAGKKVVLIIDEAQRLGHGHLEELLHLSNIEECGVRLLNLVFVGQNEFNDILLEESNRALRQRVVINYNLAALKEDETRQYISHRLKVAGCEREIFSSEAIHDIFLYSGGIPRLINIVCDFALLNTYFEGGGTVQEETVKHCVEQLRLPNERTELAWTGSHRSPTLEEEKEDKISGKGRDEVGKVIRGGDRRKPTPVKAVLVTALVLLIALLGLTLFFYRHSSMQQNSASEISQKEAMKEGNTIQEEVKGFEEKGTAGATSFTQGKPGLSSAASKISEPSPRERLSIGSEETGVSKRLNDQGPRMERRKAVGLKTTTGPTQRAPATRPRDESGIYEKEKGLDDRGKTATRDQEERTIKSPRSTTERSVEESMSREGEEVEPSRVIDWLLEQRLEKK